MQSRAARSTHGAREGVPGTRLRARVEYDGTDFAGFQAQPGRRTVQGELEAVLARLNGGERVRVDGAGRTDAGVHALGQVIAFTWPGRLPVDELARAVGALLPEDVAVHELRRAPAGFHPRFAARYREYRYTVWNGPRSPLRERHALGVRVPLDIALMAEAATALIGRHDFSAFGAADRQPVRTLYWVRVRRAGKVVTIDVAADALLRQMVRRIVAALLEVGRGTLDVAAVGEALASRQPALNGAVAPAYGLCLRRVVLGRADGHRRTEENTNDEHGQDL